MVRADVATQDVTISGLPARDLVMRALFFDSAGAILGFWDQSFTLKDTALVTIDTLHPGTPPLLGAAAAPASPTVTALAPARGAGDTLVTLTGTGFTGATAVNFGTRPALLFTVVSPTTITATVPAQAAGTVVEVQVTGPAGASAGGPANRYTYSGGNGSFGAQAIFQTGILPRSIVAGDFNGDGRLDLATANRSGNNASILLNTGMGSELAFGPSTEFAASDSPHSLVLGDFNEDGKLDLAVANYLGASVSILLGQ